MEQRHALLLYECSLLHPSSSQFDLQGSRTAVGYLQSVVASPTNAIFSLAGVSGLPTIAPVLGVLGLQTYTLNSLFIAPLVAETMDVTFTPFTGAPAALGSLLAARCMISSLAATRGHLQYKRGCDACRLGHLSCPTALRPRAGVAGSALNSVDGLLGGLLPDDLTGARPNFTVSITKDNAQGPTPVVFPQPEFSNIAGVTITARGGLLSLPVSAEAAHA